MTPHSHGSSLRLGKEPRTESGLKVNKGLCQRKLSDDATFTQRPWVGSEGRRGWNMGGRGIQWRGVMCSDPYPSVTPWSYASLSPSEPGPAALGCVARWLPV